MNKNIERMKSLLIFNPYDFCKKGGGKVYIDYHPEQRRLGGSGAKWIVVGIGFNTDSEAAWYNHGKKVFNVYDLKDKEKIFQKALIWVKEKYGIREMKKDPFGAYQNVLVYNKIFDVFEINKK